MVVVRSGFIQLESSCSVMGESCCWTLSVLSLSLDIGLYREDDAGVRKFRDYWSNVEEMCQFCSILGVNKWTGKCHVTRERGGEDRAKGLRTGVLWNNL